MSDVIAQPTRVDRRGVDPIVVLPLMVAAGLLAAWLGLSAQVDLGIVGADLAVAWTFAVAAAVALVGTRFRVAGVLMASCGLAFLFPYLTTSSWPLAWTVGFALEFLWQAVLVHLVLSFPAGRIWSRTARLVVGASYALAVGGQLVAALFWPSAANLLSVQPDRAFVDTIFRTVGALAFPLVVAVGVLTAHRLITIPGTSRRMVAPFLLAALAGLPVSLVRLWALTVGDNVLADGLAAPDRFLGILVPLGFLAGLLLLRLQRATASSLVVELRDGRSPTLRDRLAGVLGDPSLEIVEWDLEREGCTDADGRSRDLPKRGPRAFTEVRVGGAPIAALIHDRALLDDPGAIESVAATAGLILENQHLASEVARQLGEVRASRARIVAAAGAERERLERDLHDGAQQRLVGLALRLGLAASRVDPSAAQILTEARDDLERALAELREFARGIHPVILREDGLDAAVEALARRTPLPVEIEGALNARFAESVELAGYFFVSEALTNVAKHAHASVAQVRLGRRRGALTIAVSDDGVGGAVVGSGSGLSGLADRIAALDGTVWIESAPGGGTTVSAEIPCG